MSVGVHECMDAWVYGPLCVCLGGGRRGGETGGGGGGEHRATQPEATAHMQEGDRSRCVGARRRRGDTSNSRGGEGPALQALALCSQVCHLFFKPPPTGP